MVVCLARGLVEGEGEKVEHLHLHRAVDGFYLLPCMPTPETTVICVHIS
jgi:hypothetical protein